MSNIWQNVKHCHISSARAQPTIHIWTWIWQPCMEASASRHRPAQQPQQQPTKEFWYLSSSLHNSNNLSEIIKISKKNGMFNRFDPQIYVTAFKRCRKGRGGNTLCLGCDIDHRFAVILPLELHYESNGSKIAGKILLTLRTFSISGLSRQASITPSPTYPVVPVMMTFILL